MSELVTQFDAQPNQIKLWMDRFLWELFGRLRRQAENENAGGRRHLAASEDQLIDAGERFWHLRSTGPVCRQAQGDDRSRSQTELKIQQQNGSKLFKQFERSLSCGGVSIGHELQIDTTCIVAHGLQRKIPAHMILQQLSPCDRVFRIRKQIDQLFRKIICVL